MGEKLTAEQLEAILEFSEKNMTEQFRTVAQQYGPVDPSMLPEIGDQSIRRLFRVYDSWVKTQQKKVDEAGGTTEADLRMSLKVTPFFVDVGFTDPQYVDEVVNDWMAQDLARAEEAGLDEVAAAIREKMAQLRQFLPQST